ncbi:hypothetical protein CEXT_653381 [Caerostris extrusa]|uniref:Uncharacterized protein n=1 Tax=Caerostris extrusa TaxID=172846 RepID=A0AAV4WBR8_CAEEX|nr:hypothetical protein CEXT_653381 [Caerostris extrusa]
MLLSEIRTNNIIPIPSAVCSKKPLTWLCRASISVCSGRDIDRHVQVCRPNNKMSSAGKDRRPRIGLSVFICLIRPIVTHIVLSEMRTNNIIPIPPAVCSKKPLTRLHRAAIYVCSGQDIDRHAQVSRPNNKIASAGRTGRPGIGLSQQEASNMDMSSLYFSVCFGRDIDRRVQISKPNNKMSSAGKDMRPRIGLSVFICSIRPLVRRKKPLTRLCRATIYVCSGQDVDRHAQVSRPNNKIASAGKDRRPGIGLSVFICSIRPIVRR